MHRSALLVTGITFALIGLHLPSASTATAATPPLKFSRWVANPSGKDYAGASNVNRETIAVTNTTSKSIAVAGYRVKDRQGYTFVFPKGSVLRAKSTVIIHTGKGTNSGAHVYWKQGFYVWNNNGDTAYLQNSKGATVFKCTYSENASGVKNC